MVFGVCGGYDAVGGGDRGFGFGADVMDILGQLAASAFTGAVVGAFVTFGFIFFCLWLALSFLI